MVVHLLIIAVAVALSYFALVWAIGLRVKNYGFLDVAWSYSAAILAPIYAFHGAGNLSRRILFTALGVTWSLRLGSYILRRVLKHHPKEDVRYRTLREQWPSPFHFLLFFELQALIAVVLSLPFLLFSLNTAPDLGLLEMAGAAVALISIIGESTSDWQMQHFKHQAQDSRAICREGLWRYSRHPNYFFEALFWVGIALACLASPNGWIALICPLLMLYFLLKVTGIALTERHSLETKGDAYREYQRTTRAFVPWFPKKS